VVASRKRLGINEGREDTVQPSGDHPRCRVRPAVGIEPEVAEAAQAGRRATAELCATFWSRHRRRAARPRDRRRGAGSRHRCPHLCGYRCAPQAYSRMDRGRAPSS